MIGIAKQTLLAAGAALLLSLNPQDAELVKDLNDEPSLSLRGFVTAAVPAGDQLYFIASLPRGEGLWRTDGTEEGTVFLRSMSSTFDLGSPQLWSAVTDEGEMIFRHPDTGFLSRTDGTVEGTEILVGELSAGERPRGTSNLVPLPSGRWIFSAFSPAEGGELWATDGTAAGTELLDFVRPGEGSGVAGASLADLGGKALFFSTPDAVGGPVELREHSLWITDGTAAGTTQVAELGQGSPAFVRVPLSPGGSSPRAVLFQLFRPGGVVEVWITDGTAEGTLPLEPVPAGSLGATVEEAAVLGEELIFTLHTREEPAGRGPCFLMRSSGLAATEVLAFRDVSGFPPDSGFDRCPFGLVASGGKAYFTFDDGIHGTETWVSDGTEAGTRLISDLNPGEAGSFSGTAVPWRGEVAFTAFLGHEVGVRIMASDGTAAGTRQISERSGLGVLTSWGEQLVFSSSSLGSVELRQTAGSPASEARIAVLDAAVASSNPRLYLRLGDRALLGASTGGSGGKLGTTDGTAAGTVVQDLTPDLPSNTVASPVKVFGGRAYFSNGFEILRTDGTPQGTDRVAESRWFVQDFGKVGRWLVYPDDGGDGVEPWVSDGTPEGTFQLLDIFPGGAPDPEYPDELVPNSSFPHQFTRWGSSLVFTAENEEQGREIWITDGTPAGTRTLETIIGPSPSPFADRGWIYELEPIGDRLFFTHSDSGLWVTDGTAAGTRPVLDSEGAQLAGVNLAAYRGRCLLVDVGEATEGETRLLLTDGTPEGTRELAVLPVPRRMVLEPVVVGDRIYFSLEDPDLGWELWTSDGTAAGTGLVADLWPGPESSSPRSFVAVDGRLLFAADHPDHGVELWTSDGTAEGTRLLAEVQAGVGSSRPRYFTALGASVLFAAYREDVGQELFRIDRALLEAGCRPGPRTLCLQGGRFSVSVDWRNQRTGTFGVGTALDHSEDTGMFWFFNEENVELLVKLLDGRHRNGHHWAFAGALTDVETWVTVVDHETGKERTYHTPPREPLSRQLCGFAETRAFDDEDPVQLEDPFWGTSVRPGGAAARATPPLQSAAGEAGECSPGPNALLLQDGRFSVEVTWETTRQGGRSGVGTPVPATNKSGYFWFFNPANLELVVKVLDGRPSNGHFWVLYGALSDVGYEIEVTDLETCASKTYVNVEGNLCGRADVMAF